jgi:son of sevenless-like protein
MCAYLPRLHPLTSFQIFYVHSVTGEVSRELPADGDSEAPSDLYSFTDPGTSFTTRSRSNSRATDTTAADGRDGAGLGGRRLSITPDPWVKRQTEDGLAFYYVNPQTGETSWAPPSPTLEDKTRQRSYSDATYNSNRESVVSDSSDIHPFMSTMPGASATEPDDLDGTQNTPAELAALQLQEALSTSSKHNFNQLISETRAATATIWEPALMVDDLSGRVDTTVATIRKLLYRAGTLPASGKMQEILAERDEPGQSRVKITQRKLVTTLSKVVLEARAITLNPANGLGRVQQYASDLDECIINFAQEIERRNLAEVANSRLAGLVSAEGAAGVGIGLVGAGLGGGWKGFGYVPTAENAPQRVLSSSLITDFQDQEAILREKAEGLSTSYSGPNNSSSESG